MRGKRNNLSFPSPLEGEGQGGGMRGACGFGKPLNKGHFEDRSLPSAKAPLTSLPAHSRRPPPKRFLCKNREQGFEHLLPCRERV